MKGPLSCTVFNKAFKPSGPPQRTGVSSMRGAAILSACGVILVG